MGAYDLPPETPGFAEAQALCSRLSEPAADLPGARLDIPYGPDPRHRLDVFPAGPNAPVVVFVRGGYWVRGDKEERRFPACAWHPRGVTFALGNYRLAPAVTLSEMVADTEAMLAHVIDHALAYGGDPSAIHLVGNSAGGHLAAMVAGGPLGQHLASLTLVSGLFDLEPLLQEEANEWLCMDAETARAMSPIDTLPPVGVPMLICVGADETPAFVEQSKTYAEVARKAGRRVTYVESPGQNHMSLIPECGMPGTPVFDHIARLVGV